MICPYNGKSDFDMDSALCEMTKFSTFRGGAVDRASSVECDGSTLATSGAGGGAPNQVTLQIAPCIGATVGWWVVWPMDTGLCNTRGMADFKGGPAVRELTC